MVIFMIAWTSVAMFIAAFTAGTFMLHPSRRNGRRVVASMGLAVAMLGACWVWFRV